ncbi:MAG TPA: GtrA family protein [Usitatibacteraceae bacterium]|nr:GtrA family protein [Usitatibacteraceae bacterium]
MAARRLGDAGTALRYVVTMGAGWAADFVVFAITYAWMGIPGAQFLARVAGAAIGFALHRHFTFRAASSRPFAVQALWYIGVWTLSYVLSTVLLVVGVEAGLHPLVAKVGVELLIVPMNFLLLRALVFTPR